MPVEAKVAAILRPIWPDLPSPVTISRPLALPDQVDGGGKGRAEIGLQRRRDRGDAAALGIERAQGRLDGGVSGVGAG